MTLVSENENALQPLDIEAAATMNQRFIVKIFGNAIYFENPMNGFHEYLDAKRLHSKAKAKAYILNNGTWKTVRL